MKRDLHPDGDVIWGFGCKTDFSACWWWLRSPGNNSNNAANVNNNGNVNANGNNVNNDNNAVRPALSDQPEAKSMRISLCTDKGIGFPPEAGRDLCE